MGQISPFLSMLSAPHSGTRALGELPFPQAPAGPVPGHGLPCPGPAVGLGREKSPAVEEDRREDFKQGYSSWDLLLWALPHLTPKARSPWRAEQDVSTSGPGGSINAPFGRCELPDTMQDVVWSERVFLIKGP